MDHPLPTALGVLGLIAASVLAVLDELTLLTDALIGVGIGIIVARLLIYRLERRHGELPGKRVRQLETTWTLIGIGGAILIYILAEGLP